MPPSVAKSRVLVVDDDPLMLETWRGLLGADLSLSEASDAAEAERRLATETFDLVLLDLQIRDDDGLVLLKRLRAAHPDTECIVVTGYGTVESAVEAMKLGAFDFLSKASLDWRVAKKRIESALDWRRLKDQNAALRSQLEAYGPEAHLVGVSPAFTRVSDLAMRFAAAEGPVLLLGESGTGKELVARAIHARSHRQTHPLLVVNCAAIPETLLDSELFGHERGAFTGAVARRRGLFEAAHGGSLFLDEIGDMPLATQVRLLRVLQEGEVRPVGATKSLQVDVRLIAATNVDLQRAIAEGRFREDLFFRISTFTVEMPPLRRRMEDLPLLAAHILDRHDRRMNHPPHQLSQAALDLLTRYRWPGNVRELKNALEYATMLAEDAEIAPHHLPPFLLTTEPGRTTPTPPSEGAEGEPTFAAARDRLVEDFERRYLSDLLTRAGGNLSEAARRSGVDRSNLRRMLKKHRLDRASDGEPA